MSETQGSHHFFDLFRHEIRLILVKTINIGARSFSDLNKAAGNIEGAKLNFHLKKLLEGNVIEKQHKSYNLTEFGFRALSFIEAFESGKSVEEEPFTDDLDEVEQIEEMLDAKHVITIEQIRPKGLPPAVRTIPFLIGDTSINLNQKISLSLPPPVELDLTPKKWIKDYIQPIKKLFKHKDTQKWLESRMLKLAYGTRGLRDYCILDSSLAVPPLKSLFEPLSQILITRGKAGLFAKTGMGKSRLILYLTHWWLTNHGSQVLLIDNPKDLTTQEWEQTYGVLSDNISADSGKSGWLLIIEDVHLTPKENLEMIRKFVSNSGPATWSILIAFTEIDEDKFIAKENLSIISSIKKDVIPLEMSHNFNLSNSWLEWRPFFHEWIQWVALDILLDYVPWKNQNWNKIVIDRFNSPWSFVVSLGFLKTALENLQSSITDNTFPITLYSLLSILFILREEQGIHQSQLSAILESTLLQELKDIYSDNWKEELIEILEEWVNPLSRLLPPFNYKPVEGSLKQEIVINFYHFEWATYVCEHLLNKETDYVYKYLCSLFKRSAFPLYYLWEKLMENLAEEKRTKFLTWIRLNTRFDFYKGELLLVYLNFNKEEYIFVNNFIFPKDIMKDFNNTQILNLAFIKSVISNI
ncbi:MAG: hypothetical protein HeimC3_31170 [Candidatus Heimdallarchaeota archaeon LC_3]|nr:MAG: hypothetical protein HeimC3_31170 [Candidatus Heimdallarchaeota archaeon LC_3]